MEKWFCWAALGVAGVLLLLSILDIAVSFPFQGISPVIDVITILASGVLGFLAWDALRELR